MELLSIGTLHTGLLHHISDAVILVDSSSRIDFLNTAAERLTGLQQSDLKGQKIGNIFRLAAQKQGWSAEDMLAQLFAKEEPEALDACGVLTDFAGTERPIDGKIVAVKDDNGSSSYAAFIVRPKESCDGVAASTQHHLNHSEELRHLAQEVANVGAWEWDLVSNRIICSDELWRLNALELPRSEPFYEIWRETLHPDERERVEHLLQEAIRTGSELNAEWRVAPLDGKERWLMARARVIHDREGVAVKMIGITVDITERKRAEEKRLESDERYWLLFNNTLNGLAYCRIIIEEGRAVDFVCEKVNSRVETMTGWKNIKRIENRRISELVPGIHEYDPLPLKVYERVAMTGEPERFECYMAQLQMWLDISVFSPKTGYFIVAFDIITERKRIEQALRESEKKFRSITEQMAEMVFVLDAEGIITYVSPAIEKISGYTSQEVIGHLFTDFFVGGESSVALAQYNETLSSDVTAHVHEFRIRKKNGSFFYGEVHVHYSRDQGSVGAIGLLHDITERKRNEAVMEFRLRLLQLSDSYSLEELLRATLDEAEKLTQSTIGFIHFLNPDQISISLQAWSTSTEKHLCQVKEFRRHYALSEAGVWADAIREGRALIHNSYESLSTRKGMPQGHVELMREMVVPVMRSGKICAVIGIGNKAEDYNQDDLKMLTSLADIAWDIAARKQAELSESNIQHELLQAQKMELVGRLAGGIAHDFNNMLYVILGHTEMALLDEPLDQSLKENLQEIYNAAERSAELTRQLLAFARKQPLIPKVLDLNLVIEGTLSMLRRLIGEDITLEWHPDPELALVNMDASHIDQILTNLCVNARDAISEKGRIVIETKNVRFDESFPVDQAEIYFGDYVMLSVSDNGCGIAKNDAGYIFEPFFTTKEFGQGVGLGLSTVYGIVKQNEGFIKFSTESGKGTSFRVYFQKYRGCPLSADMESQIERPAFGEETILIVDDENEILKLSKMILQKYGYQVVTASTPGQALRVAEEYGGEIHLLFSDIIMPEMNGHELSKKMLSIYPNIKTLFMSGYTADILAAHGGVEAGINVIQKPFSVKVMMQKVYDAMHDNA